METNSTDAAFGFSAQLSREEDIYNHGLTKREFFAAMVIQGLCANKDYALNTMPAIAKNAIMLADTLIQELNRTR